LSVVDKVSKKNAITRLIMKTFLLFIIMKNKITLIPPQLYFLKLFQPKKLHL